MQETKKPLSLSEDNKVNLCVVVSRQISSQWGMFFGVYFMLVDSYLSKRTFLHFGFVIYIWFIFSPSILGDIIVCYHNHSYILKKTIVGTSCWTQKLEAQTDLLHKGINPPRRRSLGPTIAQMKSWMYTSCQLLHEVSWFLCFIVLFRVQHSLFLYEAVCTTVIKGVLYPFSFTVLLSIIWPMWQEDQSELYMRCYRKESEVSIEGKA